MADAFASFSASGARGMADLRILAWPALPPEAAAAASGAAVTGGGVAVGRALVGRGLGPFATTGDGVRREDHGGRSEGVYSG